MSLPAGDTAPRRLTAWDVTPEGRVLAGPEGKYIRRGKCCL